MPSILELFPNTNLGYKGGSPDNFDMGPNSTLHYHSSLDGNPPFSVYDSIYLKGKVHTNLSTGTLNPVKYLDNTPK